MPCHIITPWGDHYHVVDKTFEEVVELAEQNRPFVVTSDSVPGPNSRMWVRSAAVQAVVDEEPAP